MRRILLTLFAWLFATGLALAGTTTIQITVGSGTTYRASTDGSSNLFGNYGLCDFTACAAGLAITTGSPTSAQGAAVVDIGPNSATLPVSIAGTVAVSGTFWQATQPISAASLPLPSGAATSANQSTQITAEQAIQIAVASINTNVSSAIPAGTNLIGFTSNDPCNQLVHSNANISIATSTQLITGTSGKKTYICSAFGIAAGAVGIDIQEGTGTLCATSPSYLLGGPVASVSIAANGGFAYAGAGSVIPAVASPLDNVCLIETSAVGIGGNISYVQQ